MLTVAATQTPEPAPVLPAGWAQSVTRSVRHKPSDWTAPRSASVRIMESVTTYLELVSAARDGRERCVTSPVRLADTDSSTNVADFRILISNLCLSV